MPGEITKFLGFKIFAEFYQNSEISASNLCVFKKKHKLPAEILESKREFLLFLSFFDWLFVCWSFSTLRPCHVRPLARTNIISKKQFSGFLTVE